MPEHTPRAAPGPLTHEVEGRAAMADLAEAVGRVVRAGDVLVLTGELGAGKTTFTQFLARSLDVRGRVSSPTFVIAREHPPRGAGPGLIHADAYRLGGADEFEDLGLDAWLDESVTVVEWGRGMAETLGDHLDIEIRRGTARDGARCAAAAPRETAAGPDVAGGEDDDGPRTVALTAHGESWTGRLAQLRSQLGGPPAPDRPHEETP